jgi:hypothetical protein
MTQIQRVAVLAIAFLLGAVVVEYAQAQAPEGSRRGSGRGATRGSLLGLLGSEQVQREMKLTEEQTTKVNELVEKLGAEAREEYAALRDMDDAAQRRAKYTELSEQIDDNVREQLRDVIEREQMMRLYQIRMQVRAIVDSLSNEYVARRLELNEEQQKKVTEIRNRTQEKQWELYGAMRNAGDDQQSEVIQKFRDLRSAAADEALAVLTAEQKEAFEKMKGEKFEFEYQRGQR